MSRAKKSVLILLLGLAISAFANAAEYSVNGVQLGMSQEQVQALFGDKIACSPRTPSDTDPSQATCVNAAFAKDKSRSDTFAGQKTVIWYHILDGKVARISFLGFPSMAFDHIVSAMEPTYGKPKVVSRVMRAGPKSELVNKRATWGAEGDDAIVFDKYSAGNLDRSYLNFYAVSFPQAVRPKPVE